MAQVSPTAWAASRKPVCGNCVFFHNYQADPGRPPPKRGECRKNSPVAGEVRQYGGALGVWPEVSGADFCGEWKRAPEPEVG